MIDLINDSTALIALIGGLAFVVSLITQIVKEIPILSKIPTSLVVLSLSVAITSGAYIAYAQYNYMQIHWYMIAASIIAGFFVAFVAMFGWEKISDIYSRMIKSK
ncbi:MAG: ribonuclease [Acutalibacteraceae bacterium]|nr:ribonuclease [Acutalibacteraceae bacterium]